MKTEWIIFIFSVIAHFLMSGGIVLVFYMMGQSHQNKMKTHLENHHQTMDFELQRIKHKLERVLNDSATDRD
jgi:hypothetical protein